MLMASAKNAIIIREDIKELGIVNTATGRITLKGYATHAIKSKI